MGEAVKNGMRSGLVVIGALAFGYLSLQLIFKPYLEKSQINSYKNNDSGNPNLHRPSDEQQDSINDTAAVILDDGRPSS